MIVNEYFKGWGMSGGMDFPKKGKLYEATPTKEMGGYLAKNPKLRDKKLWKIRDGRGREHFMNEGWLTFVRDKDRNKDKEVIFSLITTLEEEI